MEIAKIQGTNTKKKLHKQKYRKILCERENGIALSHQEQKHKCCVIKGEAY